MRTLQPCFINLDLQRGLDAELQVIDECLGRGYFPSPTATIHYPVSRVLSLQWVTIGVPDDLDGGEKLWWRTQCAILTQFRRLGLPVSAARPGGTDEPAETELLITEDDGVPVVKLSKLQDLADRFDADHLVYNAERGLWLPRES
jgi:hypothetical protein